MISYTSRYLSNQEPCPDSSEPGKNFPDIAPDFKAPV